MSWIQRFRGFAFGLPASPFGEMLNMRQSYKTFLKSVILLALVFVGANRGTRADQLSFTTTVYYVGPASDGADNALGPGGTPITNPYGNSISTFGGAVTSAGSSETVTFSTTPGTAGISVGGPGQVFDIQLYGPDPSLSSPPSLISGGMLQAGTYVFDACYPNSDYFGIQKTGASGLTAYGCGGVVVPCVSGQLCNAGSSPGAIVKIAVGANGVVTIQSGGLEVGFAPTPELSTLLLFGTGLFGIAFALRRRRFVW